MKTGLQTYASIKDQYRVNPDTRNYLKAGKGVGGGQAPELTDDDIAERNRP
jgi:hypothetical protein